MLSPVGIDEQIAFEGDVSQPDHDIAALAYCLWMERGCPIGSPDDDWFQAEAELKTKVKVMTAIG